MKQRRKNMYHISKDRRAERSAERIGNGLLACMRGRSFTEITVTDVQRAAEVGRATFYRLFDNTVDVLSYLCDRVFEQMEREREREKCDVKKMTLSFITCWMENRELLEAIADCNRLDILYDSHLKYLGADIELFFPNIRMDEAQTSYLMRTMTACIAASLTAWLENGASESAEQLQEKMKTCFSVLAGIYS